MRKQIMIILATAMALTVPGIFGSVMADDTGVPAEGRSRITYVNGDVVLQPSSSGNTLEATINLPLMSGDRLATGEDGAVEFRLGDGIIGWGWHESKLEYSGISDQPEGYLQAALQLWYGAISFRTMTMGDLEQHLAVELGAGPVEVHTDTLVRFTFESDLTAIYVTVPEGSVTVQSEGRPLTIQPGRTYMTQPGSGEWVAVPAPQEDAFDAWYRERDRLLTGAYEYAESLPDDTIPPEYADEAASLHGYGRWVTISGQWYWSPYVAAGWVPYHHGYWDYFPGWGWTWIPSEPWGWTAFHFGFWSYYYDWGWLWIPTWRWRPHYACWRYDGRSVHWVAAHPNDPMDRNGMLLEGHVPINSRLEIGIPVEAGQTVNELLNHQPVRRNAVYSVPENNGQWRSRLPETLKPDMRRNVGRDVSLSESPERLERYGQPPVRNQQQYVSPFRRPSSRTVRPRQIDRPLGSGTRSGIQIRQPRTSSGVTEIKRNQPLSPRGSINRSDTPSPVRSRPQVKQPASPGVRAPRGNNPILNIFKNKSVKDAVKKAAPAVKGSKKAAGALNAN